MSIETYQFRDKNLQKQALTHSSYEYPEEGIGNNERLEFLGDAVLSALSSIFLYFKFPERDEGELSEMRSKIVNNKSLAQWAKSIGLCTRIRVGKSLLFVTLQENNKIGGNAIEALIGAIFLDLDMNISSMKTLLFPYFESILCDEIFPAITRQQILLKQIDSDPISSLQIWAQKTSKGLPVYEIETIIGSDNSMQFSAKVLIQKKVYGHGVGNNKKEAKKRSAISAIYCVLQMS